MIGFTFNPFINETNLSAFHSCEHRPRRNQVEQLVTSQSMPPTNRCAFTQGLRRVWFQRRTSSICGSIAVKFCEWGRNRPTTVSPLCVTHLKQRLIRNGVHDRNKVHDHLALMVKSINGLDHESAAAFLFVNHLPRSYSGHCNELRG